MSEPRRQRYWEEVNEGDEVPGFSLKLDWTRIVYQVSGSQDFYPVHHDPDFAHEGGHPNIFVNTGFYHGCFNRLLGEFVGDEGWIRKFRMDMRRPNYLHDTMTVKGRVLRKYVTEEGEHAVDLEIWVENERGVTTPASATVFLPTRSS